VPQIDETRYERLLEKQVQGTLTDGEHNVLDSLRRRMDRIPVGATPDAQAFDRVADRVIASLRQRRQELEARKSAPNAPDEATDASHNGSRE
jgi:hypothetical protein